jgi:hypothetical protein
MLVCLVVLRSVTGLLLWLALFYRDVLAWNTFRRILWLTGRGIALFAIIGSFFRGTTLGVGVGVMGAYMICHDESPLPASIAV